ncbi:hypothetical protein V6Z12_A03G054100 [Gossypium hirsutum]
MEVQNFGNDADRDLCADGDCNTKKVRFKEVNGGEDTTMAVDSDQQPVMSFKDKLLGGGVVYEDENQEGALRKNDSDLELLEGDVNTSIINGVPAIIFFDHIKNILFKKMELTVILKLLGCNIGYNPTKPFHLMDTTNGYFLVKFQDIDDYNKVLTQGPWIVFGQYLTPYPSVVMAWIRLLGLSGYLYKRKIIEAIGGLIRKVVKLDLQTDTRTRGRFAFLAVFINLDMPLVSQVLVDGAVQRVEYEALPMVCFNCGKYGHVKDLCLAMGDSSASRKSVDAVVVESDEVADIDGDSGGVLGDSVEGFSGKKGAGNVVGGFKGNEIRSEPFKALGYTDGVGRGAGVDSRPARRTILMSKAKDSDAVGLGPNKGGLSFKYLEKRPEGSDGFLYINKGSINNLTNINADSILLLTGLEHAKGDDAGPSGSLKVKPDGPSGDRLKHSVPLAPDGPNHSDLNNSYFNGQNFNSGQHRVEQNKAIAPSNSSGNVEKSLILNNPMFEGPCEIVVNLKTSILDPKQHSTVIFNESNDIKASKGNKKIFLVNSNKIFSSSMGRGIKHKASVNRGGASFNRTFKDKGSRLKNAEIYRVPLTEAMSVTPPYPRPWPESSTRC